MRKKSQFSFIVTLIVFIVLICYVSFATISPIITSPDINTTADTGSRLAFTSSGEGDVVLNIDQSSMEKSDNSIASTTTSNLNIVLETDGEKEVCCNYNIKWKWDNNSNYVKSSGATNEITTTGTLSVNYKNSSNALVPVTIVGNPKFNVQIPDYNASSNVLYSTDNTSKICNKNSNVLSKHVVQTWTIKVDVYALSVSQESLLGKSFAGSLSIEDIDCNKLS